VRVGSSPVETDQSQTVGGAGSGHPLADESFELPRIPPFRRHFSLAVVVGDEPIEKPEEEEKG
jgi:hypothetical protein